MGNLCNPPRRIHNERKCSDFRPNGYAFGGGHPVHLQSTDAMIAPSRNRTGSMEVRRGPDGQPLQTAPTDPQ